MEDELIVEKLYLHEEEGLVEVKNKYHRLLVSVSYKIVRSLEDSQECVEDTYIKTWNTIPPYKPHYLKSFLCKIDRQISIDRYRYNHSRKNISFEEIDYEISSKESVQEEVNEQELIRKINDFVKDLDIESQVIFTRKYFLFEESKEVGDQIGKSENYVNVKAYRIRKKLLNYLESEGYSLEKD